MRKKPLRRRAPGYIYSDSALAAAIAAGLLVFATHPASAAWLDKNQPIPDWGLQAARTPIPDDAKDAPAVVLFDEYVETIDAQGRATERERTAIRILKPQGRKNARCYVSYDVDEKINYFRAWTIGADEKHYQAQPTDFTDSGDRSDSVMLSSHKVRALRPPAADVGATILCESEELIAPYRQEKFWEFQGDMPVAFQALELILPQGRSFTASWHKHELVKPTEIAPGHWRWELKDTKRLDLRDVRSAPDPVALAGRMSVYWGNGAVEGVANQWRTFGQWCTKLESGRPTATPEITAKTQELIAGASDFYSKIARITTYIQKNIRYFVVERGIGGYQAHYAGDIFRNRYGDCKDKTTLLIAMLQVAGVQAFYMPVDHRRGVVDPDAPSFYGDHMITAIEVPPDVNDPRLVAISKAANGKRYLIFDPTNERTPAGNLPDYLQGGYGILSAGADSQVLALPVLPPEANGTERKGSFTLAADGGISGSFDAFHVGPEGADMRELLKYTDEKERRQYLEKIIAHDLPGATMDSLQLVESAELDKPMEFHYKVSAPQYTHQAGPLLLFRPRVLGDDTLPFDEKPRTLPINLGATGRWRDSFDIALPAGYIIDETPDPVDLDTEFASYHSKVSAKAGQLHYEREYVVRKVELPAEKYPEFVAFERQVLADERGTAVLKKQ